MKQNIEFLIKSLNKDSVFKDIPLDGSYVIKREKPILNSEGIYNEFFNKEYINTSFTLDDVKENFPLKTTFKKKKENIELLRNKLIDREFNDDAVVQLLSNLLKKNILRKHDNFYVVFYCDKHSTNDQVIINYMGHVLKKEEDMKIKICNRDLMCMKKNELKEVFEKEFEMNIGKMTKENIIEKMKCY